MAVAFRADPATLARATSRANSAYARPAGSTPGELRRLNAEVLAAGQLKPVSIEALLHGWPGTGSGA